MNRARPVLLVCVLVMLANFLHAQTTIVDSLMLRIQTATDDNTKLSAIFELCEQTITPDLLLPFIDEGERIATRSGNKLHTDMMQYSKANYYVRKNFTDSALSVMEPLITRYKKDKKQQALYLKFIFLHAKILDRGNQYTAALTQLVEVIDVAKQLQDTLIQIQAKTGVGWVQMEMEQYNEALKWLYDAMHTSANKKFYENYGALYSNIASAYNSLGNTDSARHYIAIAINDARKHDNLVFLATALSMQAKIFVDSKQAPLAEAPLHEVLEIRKKLDDPFYIVYDMSNLASYYASNGQPQKGIALCLEGIAIATQRGMSSQLLMIYRALAENYKAAGNTEEYGRALEYIIALKDSFNNINSSKQLAELQAASDAQKQEKTIIEQKLNLTKKNYWLFGSAVFGVMAAIITWLGFKNYRRRQRTKMQLAVEEEKRIAAQAVIDAEEQERKRIAADLHDNLGAYAASIVSNLDHLRVDDAKNTVPLQELRNNSQAIVSQLGDTIWALKKDALSLTAISDRLKVFTQRLQPSYPGVTIDITEDIAVDHLLPPSQAFHLFRIVQEAINNALRHSRCTELRVHIEGKEQWNIRIKDNGKGMYNSKPSVNGNGLSNMLARSQAEGWEIRWLAREPGTEVVIHQ